MSNQVCIKNESQCLILEPLENEYLSVAFDSDGIRFGVKTFIYNDAQALTLFFKDLAENWQGWSGPKVWKSLESDFRLEATHNGLSYMNLKVSLIKNQGEDSESQFVGNLKIELGSLVKVASDVEITLKSK